MPTEERKTMTATTGTIAALGLVLFLIASVSGIIFGLIELARWIWERRAESSCFLFHYRLIRWSLRRIHCRDERVTGKMHQTEFILKAVPRPTTTASRLLRRGRQLQQPPAWCHQTIARICRTSVPKSTSQTFSELTQIFLGVSAERSMRRGGIAEIFVCVAPHTSARHQFF